MRWTTAAAATAGGQRATVEFLSKSGVEMTEVMISWLWEKSIAEVLASKECGVPGGVIEVRAKKGYAEKPVKHGGAGLCGSEEAPSAAPDEYRGYRAHQ